MNPNPDKGVDGGNRDNNMCIMCLYPRQEEVEVSGTRDAKIDVVFVTGEIEVGGF